jgi:hypothetical protein
MAAQLRAVDSEYLVSYSVCLSGSRALSPLRLICLVETRALLLQNLLQHLLQRLHSCTNMLLAMLHKCLIWKDPRELTLERENEVHM